MKAKAVALAQPAGKLWPNVSRNRFAQIKSCGRYSCSYTAEITVRLPEPYHGTTTTTVHYPAYSNLFAGDRIQVLIDPKQPDYAELAGSPDTKSSQWVGLICGCLLFAGLTVISALDLWRLLRRRRQHRGG